MDKIIDALGNECGDHQDVIMLLCTTKCAGVVSKVKSQIIGQ